MLSLKRHWQEALALGLGLALILALSAWTLPRIFRTQPVEAPEADLVLQAQRELPFQVLIPAYLPAGFKRESVEISSAETGPSGQVMVQLVYSHPKGVTLTLSEWLPEEGGIGVPGGGVEAAPGQVVPCQCACSDPELCGVTRLMVDNGPLRIRGETSDPALLSTEHVRVILTTLAPAGGLMTYTILEEVPLTAGLPPPEEIAIDASGVQEVVLVASPSGYSPVHFSVKKDIPVRLVFRILGNVGCGNELYFTWGRNQSGFLSILNPGDNAVLEFTPRESGEFLFHCPHFIYEGVMTVVD